MNIMYTICMVYIYAWVWLEKWPNIGEHGKVNKRAHNLADSRNNKLLLISIYRRKDIIRYTEKEKQW